MSTPSLSPEELQRRGVIDVSNTIADIVTDVMGEHVVLSKRYDIADRAIAAVLAVPAIRRALAIAGEYDAACEGQGLPVGTPVARFVQHHRANAALTATINAKTLRRGQVNFDWSTGHRVWVSEDGQTVCDHAPVKGEPTGYSAWHEWAPKYGRKHKQTPCPTPGCPVLRWTSESSGSSTEPEKP